MKKLTKEEINPEVFDLYDQYAHNKIERRQFIEKLSIFAVGGITLPSLLSFIMPDYETTAEIKPGDKRLSSEYVHYDSPKGGGSIKGLLSKPTNTMIFKNLLKCKRTKKQSKV